MEASKVEESRWGPAHEALFFVLPYLPVFELLAVSQTCRSLRDAVDNDELVWMNITVGRPLNSRLSDYFLMKIAAKAAGKLKSLALINCAKITDDGLQEVIEHNPLINKLYLPACTGLTPEGVTRAVKTLTEHHHNLEALKISGIYNIHKRHLEFFQSCLHDNPKDGDRSIDVEICPRCDNVRMVFDCSRESCRGMERIECRGCRFCKLWCEECGGCIDDPEEAACEDVLCSDCWLQLPKCNFCNKPYCKKHADQQCQSSTGFICSICRAKFIND